MSMDVYGSTMFLLFYYTKEEKIDTHIKHIDHIYSNRNNQKVISNCVKYKSCQCTIINMTALQKDCRVPEPMWVF